MFGMLKPNLIADRISSDLIRWYREKMLLKYEEKITAALNAGCSECGVTLMVGEHPVENAAVFGPSLIDATWNGNWSFSAVCQECHDTANRERAASP